MKPYLIGDEAEAELIEVLIHHEVHWKQHGRNLLAEIMASVEEIARAPTAFPDAGLGHRMRIPTDLPLVIFFIDQPHRVWISAIAHGKRRYGYWRKRKPPRD